MKAVLEGTLVVDDPDDVRTHPGHGTAAFPPRASDVPTTPAGADAEGARNV
ncbi:hypothetical protein [Tsukamurella conjunctivitidis]|nr:hypothetical protein [Tsukamurella conjunctivitidis]